MVAIVFDEEVPFLCSAGDRELNVSQDDIAVQNLRTWHLPN
jgi:hypothetical protein